MFRSSEAFISFYNVQSCFEQVKSTSQLCLMRADRTIPKLYMSLPRLHLLLHPPPMVGLVLDTKLKLHILLFWIFPCTCSIID